MKCRLYIIEWMTFDGLAARENRYYSKRVAKKTYRYIKKFHKGQLHFIRMFKQVK